MVSVMDNALTVLNITYTYMHGTTYMPLIGIVYNVQSCINKILLYNFMCVVMMTSQ